MCVCVCVTISTVLAFLIFSYSFLLFYKIRKFKDFSYLMLNYFISYFNTTNFDNFLAYSMTLRKVYLPIPYFYIKFSYLFCYIHIKKIGISLRKFRFFSLYFRYLFNHCGCVIDRIKN